MIFRAVLVAAISACFLCASGQTLSPRLGSQPVGQPSQALLNALKAATVPKTFGIVPPDPTSRLTSSFNLMANPGMLGIPSPYGTAVASVLPPANRCAIPLALMPVKPTHDAIGPKTPLNSPDGAIAVPPPLPACHTK